MTRGSTGTAKVLPATHTHLKQIFSYGARALVHYAVRKEDFEVFTGDILNLNFPSIVHTMTKNGKEESYGYSSGTYARVNPMFDRVSLLPRQEEIDQLGSGISKADWEKRFELAYQKALDRNVTATMGVTPVIMAFANTSNESIDKNLAISGSSKLFSARACPKFSSSMRQFSESSLAPRRWWKCTRRPKEFSANNTMTSLTSHPITMPTCSRLKPEKAQRCCMNSSVVNGADS